MRKAYNRSISIFLSILVMSSIFIATKVSGINRFSTHQKPTKFLNNEAKIGVLQFDVSAISPYSVRLEWKLYPNGSDIYVKVIRRFITFESTIAILPSTISNFTDRWVQYGTQYGYKIVIINDNNETLAQSEMKYIITPVDPRKSGRPLYNWATYKKIKYPSISDKCLQYDSENFLVYRYTLHGVKVTVAISKKIISSQIKDYLKYFAERVFIYFHRHWTVYRAFPANEYRIVIIPKEDLCKGLGEGELGLQLTEIYTGERLSHEIGHAWIGGILNVERNLPNGRGFNIETQDSDKWILEGFEHFYGIIQLDTQEVLRFLRGDLNYYRTKMIGTQLDMPLVDLPIFFGTKNAYTYYCKGGLVAYLINKILIETDNKTLNDFMRYLYKKYNLTSWKAWESKSKLISTEDLLNELNSFSKYDFTKFFQKYVYGTDVLPVSSIEEKYIRVLRQFNETVPILVDYVPPKISITQIEVINADIYKVYWEAVDLGSGLDHFEVKFDEDNWIDLGESNSYMIQIKSPGTHVLSIKAVDKRGNAKIENLMLDTLTIIPYLKQLKVRPGSEKAIKFIIRNPLNSTAYINNLNIIIRSPDGTIKESEEKNLNITLKPKAETEWEHQLALSTEMACQTLRMGYKNIYVDYIFYIELASGTRLTEKITLDIDIYTAPYLNITKILLKSPSKVIIEGIAQPGAPMYTVEIVCNWGDGTIERCTLPASHHYVKGGLYNITLIVIQSNGEQVSKKVKIEILQTEFKDNLQILLVTITLAIITIMVTITFIRRYIKHTH